MEIKMFSTLLPKTGTKSVALKCHYRYGLAFFEGEGGWKLIFEGDL
jgi:hypothetical protein